MGAMTEVFAQCTYPQVSSSYVYSFGSYHVDKQTDATENIQRSSLCYAVWSNYYHEISVKGNSQQIAANSRLNQHRLNDSAHNDDNKQITLCNTNQITGRPNKTDNTALHLLRTTYCLSQFLCATWQR